MCTFRWNIALNGVTSSLFLFMFFCSYWYSYDAKLLLRIRHKSLFTCKTFGNKWYPTWYQMKPKMELNWTQMVFNEPKDWMIKLKSLMKQKISLEPKGAQQLIMHSLVELQISLVELSALQIRDPMRFDLMLMMCHLHARGIIQDLNWMVNDNIPCLHYQYETIKFPGEFYIVDDCSVWMQFIKSH